MHGVHAHASQGQRVFQEVRHGQFRAPPSFSLSPSLVLTSSVHTPFVRLSVRTVGGDTQAVQPAQTGRHGGQAPPATHQVPAAAQKYSQKDGRAVGAGRPQRYGEDGPSELSLFALFKHMHCIISSSLA